MSFSKRREGLARWGNKPRSLIITFVCLSGIQPHLEMFVLHHAVWPWECCFLPRRASPSSAESLTIQNLS